MIRHLAVVLLRELRTTIVVCACFVSYAAVCTAHPHVYCKQMACVTIHGPGLLVITNRIGHTRKCLNEQKTQACRRLGDIMLQLLYRFRQLAPQECLKAGGTLLNRSSHHMTCMSPPRRRFATSGLRTGALRRKFQVNLVLQSFPSRLSRLALSAKTLA